MVNIKWYGHAMFSIEKNGLVIVTDPYAADMGYSFPEGLKASVVTVSHDHFDHNNTNGLSGKFRVISDTAPLLFGPVSFEGLLTHHDESGGEERGKNIIFRWQIDDMTFTHMGDYGEKSLSSEQKQFIKHSDVLMIPVGGVFTINAEQAREIVSQVAPKIVIPMHYKTPDLKLDIGPVDNFTANADNVKNVGKSVSVDQGSLPKKQEIWVMDLFRD